MSETITMMEPLEAALDRMFAARQRDGFEREAVHTYTDATGEPAYWRIRAKHPVTGEKWIRPVRRTAAGYEMGDPPPEAYPNGKLLYRLHDLLARNDEVVFVTEGEHKADKLAALGLVVTTSGGATSAEAADWSPLAGRRVRIWPDNDEAGQRYAEAVAEAVLALGCEVELIDVEPLELPHKGDAADWLAQHPGATAEDVIALVCVGAKPERVADAQKASTDTSVVPCKNEGKPIKFKWGNGEFQLNDAGVHYVGMDKDGEPKSPLWICSLLRVIAKTRDPKGAEWGRLLEWSDDDGVRHQWAMPVELLEGDGVDVRRELARRGLHIAGSKAARDHLATYVKVAPVDQRARCVERLGWHSSVYITPERAIGDSSELVVFQNPHALDPALGSSGTPASWRDNVGALAAGNTRLVFAISVAFAGALVHIAGEDSGGFHLRGKSSSGKTTSLKVAASVLGPPELYTRAWRATANGLEAVAALHNDSVLVLDELSQCDPKEAGDAAYLLANGQGKARANRSGAARPPQRWRTLVLSAGEESLTALMARAGRKANAGQEIRLADFDADAGAGFGAFEDLHNHAAPGALALALKEAAALHHGAVGAAWLQHVVTDRIRLSDAVAAKVRDLSAEMVPAGAGGQVQRVARRFALVAVAGELATEYGLTGWEPEESVRAAKACFVSWLDGFGGTGNREEREMLAQVRAFFEAHGASRFEDVNAGEDKRILNRAGFWRQGNGGREFLVLAEAFKNEVCKGFDHKAVAKLLVQHECIAPGGDGRETQKPRLPALGTSARVYVFTEKIWEMDE